MGVRGGKSIPSLARKAIIKAARDGDDYQVTAKNLGVKPDTAYRIVKSQREETRPRGGPRNKKCTEPMIEFMAYLVGRDADLTLKQIADEVSREWNVELSTSTVARALEGRLISMKQLQLIPEARNSEVNKVKRRDFAQWLQVNAGRYRLVWIDETGYNLYTCRSKGRSAKGQRARKTCANQRGKHVTLICAVCNEGGILAWQSMLGGCKKEDFEAFLRDVLDKLANQPDGRPFCLLYDNAPCHATADNTCDALNVAYKRVSPYSCALNTIENCFSPLKSALKRMISEHGQVQPHDGESLQEARSRVLLSFCPQAVDAVTVATVSNSLVHVLTSEVPRALNGEDM